MARVPYLLAAGFKGPIYCSEASALMLPMVVEDALKVGFTLDKALISRVPAQRPTPRCCRRRKPRRGPTSWR